MKMVILSRWSKVVFFSFIAIAISAQDKIDWKKYKEKYPSHNEIILEDSEKYLIKSKKGALEITQESYYESLILSDKAINSYKESFYDSELVPVTAYHAYTISPDNKVQTTDLVNKSGSGDGAVFFDDITEYTFTYTGLEPGARKVLEYDSEYKDPNLLHRFLFRKSVPAEKLFLSVEVEKGIELGYIFYNKSDAVKYTKEEKRKSTIHRWEINDVSEYKYESRMPGLLYSEPHVAIYVKSVDDKNYNSPLLGDLDKLYAYYSGFTKTLNSETSDELKDIANTLVQGLNEEEEKVKAIYYWVKDNIKYVAYENGYEGFIPREASLVCERKFGDCKDMSSIITAMCQSVGIENVKLTWIGTRDLPYTYEEMPTPASDNHMIACYLKGEEFIFLDGTDQITPYPLPSPFIQGKEALIAIDKDNYKVYTVPTISGYTNRQVYKANFSLDQGKLSGNGTNSYHGLAKTVKLGYMNLLNEKRKFDGIKTQVLLGNNKFKLVEYEDKNIDQRDEPLIIDYSFELDNYVVSLQDESFINLFLKDFSFLDKLEDDRKYPIEFNNLHLWDFDFTLDLSENMFIESLPKNLDIDNELLSFKSEYYHKEGKLGLRYVVEIKQLMINPKDFDLWNTSTKTIKKHMKKSVTIKNKNT